MKVRDRTFGPKTSFKTLVPVDDMMVYKDYMTVNVDEFCLYL